MATSPRAASAAAGKESTKPQDLEAELARLREDVSRLSDQLARTGEHTYSAARRAVGEGAEQLRVKGEAAASAIRSNADDIERQVVDAVREKPITAIAIAAGIGWLFGLLSRR